MSFKNAVLNTEVEARTENGMKALASSLSKNVDLFFNIGASRGKDITKDFERAYQEDRSNAIRIAQWARDIRSGSGERELFRQVLRYLEKNHKNDLLETKLLANVAELGRWDDLLIFETHEVKSKAYALIFDALEKGNNGLAAKWMPRKGPIAVELREFFGWSPKFYRKRLVELTKVVEQQMCAKDWDAINFSHVPSLAMSRYTKAFSKNAKEAFALFKTKLEKGDDSVKVNAGAVYPYDVIKGLNFSGENTVANAQWDSLPNYIGDASIIPLVDVSGSMTASAGGSKNLTCMDVAVSLGLYCADKNTGAFKDLFLTFSANSKFEHLKGTLSEKLYQMKRSDWGYNTDLHKAFDEILRVATQNKVAAEDMPETLLILSDMQFDECSNFDDSAHQMIERKFETAGYKMPGIVFWNLRSTDNTPVRFDKRGTALVSGFSPSIMKSVLAADMDNMTPEGIMLTTISNTRYDFE